MENIIKGGIYKHYKGNEYMVLDIATHSETLEPMVVYKAMYGDGSVWVRPAHMWNEQVICGVKSVPRFKYMGNPNENGASN